MKPVLPVERECLTFTRYLTGAAATPYVVGQFHRAHHVLPRLKAETGHDRWLLAVARTGPPLCRAADAYARLFAPRSVLRRKLVVMLAILEVSPPFAAAIDGTPRGGAVWQLVKLAWSGAVTAAALALGLLLFMPARLLSRTAG